MSSPDGHLTRPRPGYGPVSQPMPAPVFMLAPARSYSTVSLALLAGHPALYGFPEMLVFGHPTVGALLAEPENQPDWPAGWSRGRIRGVCRAIADIHDGEQSDAAIRRARAWLARRADWTTIRLLDYLLAEVAPRIGLEKSPEITATDESLAACLAAYPEARYLHLTRHPVDTQRSMREHWGWLTRHQPPEALTAYCATAWYKSHLRIVQALDGLDPRRWMRVRAEDLLREPQVWLPAILGWLGLDAHPSTIEAMRRTECWRFAGAPGRDQAGGGDPKFMSAPRLRPVAPPGPLAFAPSLRLPAEMQRRMISLARQLGY